MKMGTKVETEIIESSSFVPGFKFEVAKTIDGEGVLRCFQCGICSASCPVSDAVKVRPHQVIREVLLGMKDEVLSHKTLWVCSICFACNVRCPQNVKPASVMFVLKNMAAKEKGVPEGLKAVGKTILEEGMIQKLTEFQTKKRAALGLPKVSKINVKDLRRLLEDTGFEETVR